VRSTRIRADTPLMSANNDATKPYEPTLVGIKPCLNAVFSDEDTRPSDRTFNEWRAKGYYPYVKIGKRVFLDPVAVRKALDKRFTIQAIES
jgi:hypothetical protein